ncbi:hypothetical protein P879_06001 [Paragonimus westermani]|uniref:Cysteine-rich DPF motif domain-containing protein 1 n=1 Tax=Paragonimus westermani TaxID=34504 RepID=A0A8T0D7S3_9TREM|nr:hypothetical protein P879_06001 [Paragonimus westermani]
MSNTEAQFCCNTCGFKINYDNKGRRPKYFNRDLELLEDAYTMRDPFADDNLGGIILGSDCCICKEMVCISQDCSLFYNKRYCRDCSVKHVDEFPLDLRQASFPSSNFRVLSMVNYRAIANCLPLFGRRAPNAMTCWQHLSLVAC